MLPLFAFPHEIFSSVSQRQGKKKSLFTSEYSAADKSSSPIAVQVLERDLSSDDGGYLPLKREERGPTGAVCCVNTAALELYAGCRSSVSRKMILLCHLMPERRVLSPLSQQLIDVMSCGHSRPCSLANMNKQQRVLRYCGSFHDR